jgi:hypothetical protein
MEKIEPGTTHWQHSSVPIYRNKLFPLCQKLRKQAKTMIALSNISNPSTVCTAEQEWMSPIGSAFNGKSLQGSTCSTSVAIEGVPLPFQASNPPSPQLQRRSCFQAAKKTKGLTVETATPVIPTEVNRRCSITFNAIVCVRVVSYAKSSAGVDRLWYQHVDYERFRAKIGKLANLAKKYREQHGINVHLPGMEKFMEEDTDTAVASGHPTTAQLRVQVLDSVLMEQFCQRQQGFTNEERISAVSRLCTMRAQVLACERAEALRNSEAENDVVASTDSNRTQDSS